MGKKYKGEKINGGFLALPYVVINSPGFSQIGHASRSFLIFMASQYRGQNNGQLTACRKWAKKFGFVSNNTITRAVRDLEVNGLIFCTRKGARPNKAAWFAITWQSLDWVPEMDIQRKDFPQSAYLHPKKINTLTPIAGVERPSIVPVMGVERDSSVPIVGAM